MKIKKLPTDIINQISAGELIENPCSIVRELIDNSIDSLATSIQIFIKNGGKTYISVADNGNGMDYDDIKICLDHHTTSKLNHNNLFSIETLGFRGEALFSIQNVSVITITSKSPNDKDHGYSVSSYFGEKSPITKSVINLGTKIEVSKLFLKTPARLKFLRSDSSEKKSIENLIKNYSLIYNEISFSLVENGEVLSFFPKTLSKSERIYLIMENDFQKNSFEINKTTITNYGEYKIYGIFSIPTFNKSSKNYQYIFINGRFIKNTIVSKLINFQYKDLTPSNRFSSFVVFIQIPPCEIDVNVHPTKSDVKFRNIEYISSFISEKIKEGISLNKNISRSFKSKFINLSKTNNHIDDIQKSNISDFFNSSSLKQSFNFTNQNLHKNEILTDSINEKQIENIQDKNKYSPQLNLMESSDSLKKTYNFGVAISQINNSYIISEVKDLGLVIIDQHAAHERINYEILKKNSLIQDVLPSEAFLIPIKIGYPKKVDYKIINLMKKFGFEIENSNNKEILLYSIPFILKDKHSEEIVMEILSEIDNEMDFNPEQVIGFAIDRICANIACRASITANQKLSLEEMNELINQMKITPNISQCNHGRPTHIFISNNDLEKMFERR